MNEHEDAGLDTVSEPHKGCSVPELVTRLLGIVYHADLTVPFRLGSVPAR